jgi:hypothetical protein
MAIADLVSMLAKHEVEFIIVGFPELVTDSDWIDLGVTRARVLKLERLIQIKQRLGRPKDRAMLPLLLATRDETHRSK